MRKVYMQALVTFTVRADDDIDFDDYISNLSCQLSNDANDKADIENIVIEKLEVVDSV
jgi:hypothetical protein